MKPWSRDRRRRLAGLLAGVGAQPARFRMLLISDGREYTSEQQFAPIWRHQRRLRRELGFAVRWLPLDAALARPSDFFAPFDAVGLKLSFRRPAAEAEAIADRLRALLAASKAKLVYFDGDDDSGILWPGMLERSDFYMKKHAFREVADHAEHFIGKSNLTTYVARATGRSFADDIIPSAGGLDPEAIPAKLLLGWSIALDDKIAALRPHPPEAARPIDICGRAWVAPGNWLHGLRAPAIAALEALPDQWSVAVPRGRVSQRTYDRELRTAKICVSPFGYGELCWRDFEAIMSGCLLVKPDIGHIRSATEILIPGVSYLPVAWDYGDLAAVCAPMLADDAARIRIARQAQQWLLDALRPDPFVRKIGWLMDRIVPPGRDI